MDLNKNSGYSNMKTIIMIFLLSIIILNITDFFNNNTAKKTAKEDGIVISYKPVPIDKTLKQIARKSDTINTVFIIYNNGSQEEKVFKNKWVDIEDNERYTTKLIDTESDLGKQIVKTYNIKENETPYIIINSQEDTYVLNHQEQFQKEVLQNPEKMAEILKDTLYY